MPSAPLYAPQGRLLAIDDEKGSLGDLALQLVRLGIDVLLASEIDEAELLARQEGEKLCAALIPSEDCELRIDQVLEAIGPHTGIGAETLALVGRRLDDDQLTSLRDRGLRWRLWSPFEDRDLRFLGWALIWAGTDHDLRIDARVPTALPASAVRRGQSRDVLIGDLSESGAYVETKHPFPAGSHLHLEIGLPAGPVQLRGLVRWVSASARARPEAVRPTGFGVEFLRPKREALAALREHLEGETSRFFL